MITMLPVGLLNGDHQLYVQAWNNGVSQPWALVVALDVHMNAPLLPVIAANRIGCEPVGEDGGQTFYGHSFVTNEWGDLLADLGRDDTGVAIAEVDLAQARRHRAGMGFFRDRRPELYGRLTEDI